MFSTPSLKAVQPCRDIFELTERIPPDDIVHGTHLRIAARATTGTVLSTAPTSPAAFVIGGFFPNRTLELDPASES
jgi:hypothetical protein